MGIKNVDVDMACLRCRGITPHTVQTPNHVLHLLLTIFTAGLWIVIWILLSLGSGKKQCERCKVGAPPLAVLLVLLCACSGNTGGGGLSDGEVVDCTIADHWQSTGMQCFASRGDHLYECNPSKLDQDTNRAGCVTRSAFADDGGFLPNPPCVWRTCDPASDARPIDAPP